MVRAKSEPRKSLSLLPAHPNPPTIIFYRPRLLLKKRKVGGKVTKRGGVSRNAAPQYSRRDIDSSEGPSPYVHPLSRFKEVGPLNDIQQLITEAIMINGEPCDFERIFDYVNAKWNRSKIRRRDGTPYATDPRRVILANLRYNPLHLSLFRKDGTIPKSWRLCHTMEEATRVAKEGADKDKHKDTMESEDVGNGVHAYTEAPISTSISSSTAVFSSAASGRDSKDRPAQSMTSKNVRTRSRNREDEDEANVMPGDKLTLLQSALSWILFTTNQPATLNTLVSLVSRHWPAIATLDGIQSTDIRSTVLTALSESGDYTFIFMREPSNFLKWRISPYHPWIFTFTDEEREKALQNVNIRLSLVPQNSTTPPAPGLAENTDSTATASATTSATAASVKEEGQS